VRIAIRCSSRPSCGTSEVLGGVGLCQEARLWFAAQSMLGSRDCQSVDAEQTVSSAITNREATHTLAGRLREQLCRDRSIVGSHNGYGLVPGMTAHQEARVVSRLARGNRWGMGRFCPLQAEARSRNIWAGRLTAVLRGRFRCIQLIRYDQRRWGTVATAPADGQTLRSVPARDGSTARFASGNVHLRLKTSCRKGVRGHFYPTPTPCWPRTLIVTPAVAASNGESQSAV
jgi:hypothetical protein